MAGSVIFGLATPEGTPPAGTLDTGSDTARIPVDVTTIRCDAHGLSGSQKTFVFPVWVVVGDAPAVQIELRPDAVLQQAMQTTIDACQTSES